MDKITTTIRREFLKEIVAGEKPIEYRDIKSYWRKRFEKVSVPFKLRLINGMSPTAPEVTVRIDRIVRNTKTQKYELHIGRIIQVKNWDRRRKQPKST